MLSGPEGYAVYQSDGSISGDGFNAVFACGADDGVAWQDNTAGGLAACIDGETLVDTGAVSHTVSTRNPRHNSTSGDVSDRRL